MKIQSYNSLPYLNAYKELFKVKQAVDIWMAIHINQPIFFSNTMLKFPTRNTQNLHYIQLFFVLELLAFVKVLFDIAASPFKILHLLFVYKERLGLQLGWNESKHIQCMYESRQHTFCYIPVR